MPEPQALVAEAEKQYISAPLLHLLLQEEDHGDVDYDDGGGGGGGGDGDGDGDGDSLSF